MTRTAVVLMAHGTVDSVADLPEFLKNIRRGHAPPPELVAEVERRYQAIGGNSPLNAINRDVARALQERLQMPVRCANRMFRPYAADVLRELTHAHALERVIGVPLAQHSGELYGETLKAAVRELDAPISVLCASNWGQRPELTEAFAESITAVLGAAPALRDVPAERAALLLTAHSLPMHVVAAGDPYEGEVRASAEAVARRVAELAPNAFGEHMVAFQSQGMSAGPGGRPVQWLGPDLQASMRALSERGRTHVVVAPIGFLADHVEILYDLDIEAQGWARDLGLTLVRSPSLNASDAIVRVLAAVTEDLMRDADRRDGSAV